MSGAGIAVVVRGPWVAPAFRDRAWKRVAWAAVIGAAYEISQLVEAQQQGIAGQPGFGFSPKDLALDIAGAVVCELVVGLGKVL